MVFNDGRKRTSVVTTTRRGLAYLVAWNETKPAQRSSTFHRQICCGPARRGRAARPPPRTVRRFLPPKVSSSLQSCANFFLCPFPHINLDTGHLILCLNNMSHCGSGRAVRWRWPGKWRPRRSPGKGWPRRRPGKELCQRPGKEHPLWPGKNPFTISSIGSSTGITSPATNLFMVAWIWR
jgi:hypothetical protein